jgi:hypothetical protein
LINDDNTIQYNGPKQRKISFQYIFEEVNKNYYYFIFSKKYKEYGYFIRKIFFDVNQKNYVNAVCKLNLGKYFIEYYIGDTLLNDKDYKLLLNSYAEKFISDYENDYCYRNYILSDPLLASKFKDKLEIKPIPKDTTIYEPKINSLTLPVYNFEYIQCEHEIAYKEIKLEKYFEDLNNYVSKYVNIIDDQPICSICSRYIKEIDMYEGDLNKKNNKLIPIVYQSIYSFAPYDKYTLSKFFIIDAISSFDTIYKTDIYVSYNKIAKLFLDWLIDININKNAYEEKYKSKIASGLFFIRLTTNLFDNNYTSKELFYDLKNLNLYIYLCTSFIYLLDPYYINIISKKIKIELDRNSKNHIIYNFLKKIYVVKEETFDFVNNIINNQEDVMTLELKEIKKNFEKKFLSYKKIVYTKEELYFMENELEFSKRSLYYSKNNIIQTENLYTLESSNSYMYENEIELSYLTYKIDSKNAKELYDHIVKNKYADYVFKKSQVTEINHTNLFIIFYYENKRMLIDYEYYNFYTPLKVYPNKYYAFLYYGRSNQFNKDVNFLITLYNELFLKINIPYFYFGTNDYDQFFIQLIGFIMLHINISFDKFLDKIKIIELYSSKEEEYYVSDFK